MESPSSRSARSAGGPREERPSLTRRIARRLRTLARLRKLYLLWAELKIAPSEAQRLFALTVVVGGLCGLAAVLFHLTIRVLEHHLIEPAMNAKGHSWIFWTIVTPTLGALASGVLLEYFPNARGSGVPLIKATFAQKGAPLRMRDSFGKFFLSALQIGSGSSLGREGPTVQICAGIASRLGRLARVSPTSLRRLLPVGAAAGVAAAFNAPIAAVTFTIEEVVGNLDQTVLSGVIVAAALSAAVERSVLGEHPIFDLPESYGLLHASSLVVYALIGVAAAGAAIVFTDSLLGLRVGFSRLYRVPRWARPALGGAVTGMAAVAALWGLHTHGVTGGGYDTLSRALTGQLAVHVMLGLCALKILATVFSYSSGGAGGIFAPSLFIGGTLGGAIGTLDHTLLGHVGEPLGAFALVGMGAAFSGIVRAPMTSVLIIVEMTGGYSLVLPLMIANMTAYVLARHFRPVPIYEALLEQDGVHLHGHSAGAEIRLEPLIDHTGVLLSFLPSILASEISRASSASRSQDIYPVVEDTGRLVGIITREELTLLSTEPELLSLTTASDLMRPAVSVRATDDVKTALEAMIALGAREVPVTDSDGRVLGFIEERTIAAAYLRDRQT